MSKTKDPAAVALGSRTSAVKAASSAANGKLGGRPSVRWAIDERIPSRRLVALDLVAHVEAEPGECECYRLIGPGGQRGDMIYYPDAGRAGIATGAQAAWTDCKSATDAVRRLNDDEMCE